MIARLSPCRGFVEIRGQRWHDRFPVEKLPGWIRFNREMAARKGGKYAHCYRPTIEALEAVAAELRDGSTDQGGKT